VSVIIIPRAREGESTPQPGDDLLQHVKTDLERRRLLTTKLHVVGPRYVAVNVQLTLVLKSDALVQDVQERAVKRLHQFFHPLEGGPEGKGWPFGRPVYLSEVYALLDQTPGVDYVQRTGHLEELTVDGVPRRIP